MIDIELAIDFIKRHRPHRFVGQGDVVQIYDLRLVAHALHQSQLQIGSDFPAIDLREEHAC